MSVMRGMRTSGSVCAYLIFGFCGGVALAQPQSESGVSEGQNVPQAPSAEDVDEGSEIIVTARKRDETALDVPVSITAMGREDLSRYATRGFEALSAQVPGLVISTLSNGTGGSISLRGITSATANPSIDQAVSFNVDGVQVGSGNIVRLGQIDLQQIEILKGPQALFFGKNSPGGVISLRSVDPGSEFEAMASLGYEFNAREKFAQIALGGPITDTLGFRLVAYGMEIDGFRKNLSPILTDPNTPGGVYAFGPDNRREPNRNEQFVRATMVYNPADTFRIRAKYNYNRARGSSGYASADIIYCPNGSPQGNLPDQPVVDNCKMDDTSFRGAVDPRVVAVLPDYVNDVGSRSTNQTLASIEADYTLAPDVTLTSVTGYYKLHDNFVDNQSYTPVAPIVAGTEVSRREISQEIRVSTARSEWPVNFTVGAYYQNLDLYNNIPLIIIDPLAGTAPFFAFAEYYVDGDAYSLFGQAIWDVTPKLEVAGGARWSRETKSLRQFHTTANLVRQELVVNPQSITFSDVSPEATITWKPHDNLAVFGAFRNGFKSGGFNTGSPTGIVDAPYRQEKVRGFEAGVKMRSGGLRINATAYRYIYSDLQVSTLDPVVVRTSILNAASAKIQGIEVDATYQPPWIMGLELRGALNYNHARYNEFLANCYTGQTIAAGCNIGPQIGLGTVASPFRFSRQDLSGGQLNLAPDWTGSLGATFTSSISSDVGFSVSADGTYSSSFFAMLESVPYVRQNGYWNLAASARVFAENKRWELAIIGENLTQVYRSRYTTQIPGTGISTRTGTNIEGGLSDYAGIVNRGRQISLQFTVRFD